MQYGGEKLSGHKVDIEIKNIEDYRNYKVNISKAKIYLGYQPQYTVTDIVDDLYHHKNCYGDYENDNFYNIRVFQKILSRPKPQIPLYMEIRSLPAEAKHMIEEVKKNN